MALLPFDALTGPTYSLFSTKADVQRAINLYRARIESGEGQTNYVMYRSPGLQQFALPSGGAGRARGSFELNGHLFHVIDGTIYDVAPNGQVSGSFGPIANDGEPVQMAADPFTLVVVSAGQMYWISGTLNAITLPFTPIGLTFVKGYFVALSDTLRQFYFSTDGRTWDAANVQTAEADANNMLAIIRNNQQLCIVGNRIAQFFSVGSDPNAPFVQRDDGVLNYGIAAPNTLRDVNGLLIWLSADRHSQGEVVMARGYSVTPISNEAVSNAIRGYGDVSTAYAWAYGLNSQDFYRITFPSANNGRGASWDYNATLNEWSEVGYWNVTDAQYERHRGSTGVQAFGKTLVGDHTNGKLYEMSPDFYSDDGDVIRWLRRCPHLIKENKRVQYNRFEVFGEWGVGDGSNGDPVQGTVTPEYDPQMMIRWSDDGGESYSNYMQRSMGQRSARQTRVLIDRCGTAVDRVFEISGTAKTKLAILGGQFDAELLNA